MAGENRGGASKADVVYSAVAAVVLLFIAAAALWPRLQSEPPAAPPPAANAGMKDGVYQGRAKGYSGDVVCDVRISGGKISDVKVVSSSDDAPRDSFTAIPAEIIKRQSADVAAVTGATYSSKGVMGAVSQALAKARSELKDEPQKKKDSPHPEKFTASPRNCKDGEYIGIGRGTRQITVSVSLKDGRITAIKTIDQRETMPGEALEKIIPQILERQSLDGIEIPAYSDKTARGLLEAVNMALTVAAAAGKLESDIPRSLLSRVIKTVKLPSPDRDGGMPLMRALSQRKSSRSFSGKALTHQEISNLLWAAFGINRPDKGRTAPSDMNMQETLIFLAMADGLFVYDARANAVLQISAADIRKDTAYQHFAAAAPLDLIFAADLNAMKVIKKEEEKESAAAVDAALVGENVYLYCASAGLNTVLLGWFDKKKLREIMGLDDSFILTFTQPVGYPPDKKGE